VNCSVVPAAIDGFSGVTAIEARFGGAPVPLRAAVCGLLFALSVNDKVPLREPCALGEKVTDALQLAPAASVPGLVGQADVTEKSLRLLVILLIVRAAD
jgi:hypothetical protein